MREVKYTAYQIKWTGDNTLGMFEFFAKVGDDRFDYYFQDGEFILNDGIVDVGSQLVWLPKLNILEILEAK